MPQTHDTLKLLARQKRAEFGVTTETLNLNVVRRIYRALGVPIDAWALSSRLRAVYMCEDNDPSVLINRRLPKEPRLFALIHELKHHFVDRPILEAGTVMCGDYNANREIEVGAEVFAAEFIYPEAEFLQLAKEMGLTAATATAEDIVRFKRACPAVVSYQFIRKRFEWLNLAPRGKFAKVKFKVLEEQLFGVPFYKQEWFRARRTAVKRSAS